MMWILRTRHTSFNNNGLSPRILGEDDPLLPEIKTVAAQSSPSDPCKEYMTPGTNMMGVIPGIPVSRGYSSTGTARDMSHAPEEPYFSA